MDYSVQLLHVSQVTVLVFLALRGSHARNKHFVEQMVAQKQGRA